MQKSLASNRIIGILGGGQLARMLSLAAAPLGYKTCIYCPEESGPALDVCHSNMVGEYNDETKLKQFADQVDVITYEFENIPSDCIEFLSKLKTVSPNLNSLKTAQDRLVEKDYLNKVGTKTAPYANVSNHHQLDAAITKLGLPAILKTRTMGYDGKGQCLIRTSADIADAYHLIDNNTHGHCILEGFIEFDLEISVIIARNAQNQIAIFDPSQNDHKDQILHKATIPANVSQSTIDRAKKLATDIIIGLDYIGVLAVELFISTKNDEDDIIVNEIAPRVHNSGHWTQDACYVSQFEQHIRSICNLPLGNTARHSNAIMLNLIGNDVNKITEYATMPNASIHLYGKLDIKEGRKMGHVNLTAPLTNQTKP